MPFLDPSHLSVSCNEVTLDQLYVVSGVMISSGSNPESASIAVLKDTDWVVVPTYVSG